MKDTAMSWLGTGLTVASAVFNAEVRDIISWVITIIVGLVTIGFTLYKWFKKANADGNITEDEIKELTDELKKTMKGEDNE